MRQYFLSIEISYLRTRYVLLFMPRTTKVQISCATAHMQRTCPTVYHNNKIHTLHAPVSLLWMQIWPPLMLSLPQWLLAHTALVRISPVVFWSSLGRAPPPKIALREHLRTQELFYSRPYNSLRKHVRAFCRDF